MILDQEELREEIKGRCQPQKAPADFIGISRTHFNNWLHRREDLGYKSLVKANDWLNKQRA